MKKVVALIGLVFIASAITYFSFDWNSQKSTEASQNVSLTDGSTVGLVPEEIALKVNEGEKKVIVTDLGMV
jgi:hypothetical protein